jgi:hypothetical protein
MYGAEMLCGSFGASHAINLFVVGMSLRLLFVSPIDLSVIDDVVWIWYYDRQGVVQSEGINFLDDWPSFLVLLYALQRLELEQWGLNPRLDYRVRIAHHGGTFPRDYSRKIVQPTEWEVNVGPIMIELLTERRLYSALGITGRGTVAVEARSNLPGRTRKLAVKLYWPEQVRPKETEIIAEARALGRRDPAITNHLPVVIAEEDFPYFTGNVRNALGVSDGRPGYSRSRVMRVIVFTLLEPITKLRKSHFVRAWLECLRCKCYHTDGYAHFLNHQQILLGHFKLWELGFEHGDPSLANLMIDPATNRGVLNDWDLSFRRSRDRVGHVGGERTGTVPFMAMDLLCRKYWDGEMERLYRHDLEGLIWILPWVFLQFQGTTLEVPQLASWSTGDYLRCAEKKAHFYVHHTDYIPMNSWKSEWALVSVVIGWRQRLAFTLQEGGLGQRPQGKRRRPEKDQDEASRVAQDVFNDFCRVLWEHRGRYRPLAKLMRDLGLNP